jgi:hypothetical protein
MIVFASYLQNFDLKLSTEFPSGANHYFNPKVSIFSLATESNFNLLKLMIKTIAPLSSSAETKPKGKIKTKTTRILPKPLSSLLINNIFPYSTPHHPVLYH